VTGSKAELRETSLDIVKNTRQDRKRFYGVNRENFSGISSANASLSGINKGSQAKENSPDYLKRAGDAMNGPQGFNSPEADVEIDAFNTINIGSDTETFSSNILVFPVGSSNLDIIAGAAFDGQLMYLKTFGPGTFNIRQATLANGGNIQTLDENDFTVGNLKIMTLMFDAKLVIFGNTGGTWRVITTGSVGGGGGSNIPDGTIENQHIEWNNITSEWEAKVNLEFGSTGPFADDGFIRFASDQIMLSARNPFNTGNVEIKTDSVLSRIDITDSGQGGSVGLLLRAQDSIDPDQTFSLSQGKGIGGDSILVTPTRLIIDAGVTSFAFALDATDLILGVDLNVNTFDVYNVDQLAFQSTIGTLDSVNVGFGALGSGGFRANILNDGEFQWTEENTLLMKLSESSNNTMLDLVGVLSSGINLSETTSGSGGSIFQGTATLQYTTTATQHEFLVGVEPIVRITSDGIVMQGLNFIRTPQIGFSILGNIIQDDVTGMIFDTPPNDSFRWRDGTNIFASLDIDGFFLNDLYVQYQHIVTPTVPGLITQGQVFFNTATNRLSFQRRNDGDTAWIISDLEAATSIPSQIVAGDSSISVVDTGTGAFSFVLDGLTVSTVDLSEWLFGVDLDIDSNDILNPANIILANGFQIQNTSASITTLDVPSNEELIFAEAGTEVARYDGNNNNWIFNPVNDVQLSPGTDVDLTPGGDIVMNPTGDIRVFNDFDMDGANTIDFGTSASVPIGSAIGAAQIKINGVTRLVKFYST
jgi:hypothetical protein